MSWDKLDHILSIAGIVVPLASVIVGSLNQKIRVAKEQGMEVPVWLLQVVSVLNILAINLDKANQLAKTAKAQKEAGVSGKAIVAGLVTDMAANLDVQDKPSEQKKE